MSGIAVEIMPDAGAPQVGVTIDGLAGASTSVVTVSRSWDGGATWYDVRGAVEVPMVGSGFLRDHVPPLNVETTYRLTVVSGATVPATLEATITVPSDTAWIQDPLNPRAAVPLTAARNPGALMLLSATAAQVVRAQPVDRVTPEGARLPVASYGTRQAPSGVPFVIRAVAAEQGGLVKALRGLFDTAGQLVLRGLPEDLPLDPVAHVGAGDVVEVPVVGGRLGLRNDWQLTLTQERPTSLRIAIPWWTYDQVKAMWAAYTYATAAGARPGDTYLDWLRSPEVP